MQEEQKQQHLCLVVIGMSGTGKTTFVNVRVIIMQKFSKTF